MSYTRQTWTNGSAGGTPLSAARLTHIEEGIAASRGAVTGEYLLTDYGTIDTTGTVDATAAVNAAHAAMYAAGGAGTLIWPAGRILIAGQIILPNDGGGVFATGAPLQPPYTWQGQGGYHSGQAQSSHGTGGTRLLLTYQDATYNNAKIVTRGLGRFTVRGITFQDPGASSTTPFLYTTCTTLRVSECAFLGSSYVSAPAQDAIVLGGTKKADESNYYDDPDSAFQGYGTVIEGNYFNRIRRVVYGRSYCNHTVTSSNFMDKQCGTNLAGGACIEFNGRLSSSPIVDNDRCTANVVTMNYMNGIIGYAYQVKLVSAVSSIVAFNGSPDQHNNPSYQAFCRAESASDPGGNVRAAFDNLIIANLLSGVGTVSLSEDAASTGQNTVLAGGIQGHFLNGKVVMRHGGAGAIKIDELLLDGTSPLLIQPAAAVNESGQLFVVRRSAAEASNPGVVILGVTQKGTVAVNGTDSGTLTFGDAAGTARAGFEAAGRTWKTYNDSGQLNLDTSPANNWINHRSFGHRFYDNTGSGSGALRLSVGMGADQIRFGANGASGPAIISGTGSPEGARTAPVGSLFLRVDGGAGTTLWVKESGTGNTGWVAK